MPRGRATTFLVQGMGGLMSITGPIEGPPYKAGIAVADVFTGLYATIAVQAALFRASAQAKAP